MESSGIRELKKNVFNFKKIRVDRLVGLYMDTNGNQLTSFDTTMLSLDEQQQHKYLDILKKSISGKFGKNLFNLSIDRTDGNGKELYNLTEKFTENRQRATDFIEKFAETYQMSGRTLFLLAYCVYDVPKKASDGTILEDNEETYSFVVTTALPVALVKEGLVYSDKHDQFIDKYDDWAIGKPETAFLYPAFNNRSSDMNEALFFTKKADMVHKEIIEEILGSKLTRTEDMQKNVYSTIVEDTFGRDLDFKRMKTVTNILTENMKAAEKNGESYTLGEPELRTVLRRSGADEEALKRFKQSYKNNAGNEPIHAESVNDVKNLNVKTDDLSLSVKTEFTDAINTRVIDGREYVLIPVTNNMTVNGVPIRESRKEK